MAAIVIILHARDVQDDDTFHLGQPVPKGVADILSSFLKTDRIDEAEELEARAAAIRAKQR